VGRHSPVAFGGGMGMRRLSALMVQLALLAAGCAGGTATTTTVVTATSEASTTTTTRATTTTEGATAATSPGGDGGATVIFHGGPIVTMEDGLGTVEAIALDGDEILAVGDAESVLALAGEGTEIIELEGMTVLPGLIDSHAHWIGDRNLVGIDSAEDAILAALQQGFTSISELFVNEDRLAELIALDEAGLLSVRVNMYFPVNYHTDHFGIWFRDLEPGSVLSPHLRMAGAKAFIDPANAERFWLTDAHSDDPDYYGEVAWTQEELTAMVVELDDLGWQVAIHTAGDAAHDMVLNAYEAALDGGPNDLRHRIEHVVLLRDDQMQRMIDLDIVASIQFTWFQSDWIAEDYWPLYEQELGLERMPWVGRWRDLLDAGVMTIGGTDTPWTAAVSVGGLYEAVTRTGATGTPPDVWMLDQRITVEEALRLITADAAYGTFEEDIKGTLAPGRLADLIVVSANPLEIPAEQLIDLEVLAAVVGGETVYCAQAGSSFCP
jgi:predicted amidohydrolase YtcJ